MNAVTLNPNIYIPGELVLLSGLLGHLRCQHAHGRERPARDGEGWDSRTRSHTACDLLLAEPPKKSQPFHPRGPALHTQPLARPTGLHSVSWPLMEQQDLVTGRLVKRHRGFLENRPRNLSPVTAMKARL